MNFIITDKKEPVLELESRKEKYPLTCNLSQVNGLIHLVETSNRVLKSTPTKEQFLGIIMHNLLNGGEHNTILQKLFPPSQPRTLKDIASRIQNLKMGIETIAQGCSWFIPCISIYNHFDPAEVGSIWIGDVERKQQPDWGGKYLITDGGHRAIVIAIKVAEGMKYTPVTVYKNE